MFAKLSAGRQWQQAVAWEIVIQIVLYVFRQLAHFMPILRKVFAE